MSGSVLTQLTKQNLTSFSSLSSRSFDLLDNGRDNSLSSPTPPPRQSENIDFKKYEDRLKSYDKWYKNEIAKEVLARAGFYYTNYNDVVRCPFCHIEGYQWLQGDDPMEHHRNWSPACPFVMNVVDSTSARNNRNVDTCGLYGIEVLVNSGPEDEIGLENLGMHKGKGPAHPDKFTFDVRLKTFFNPLASWPRSMKQKPHDLAEAGFYYVGMGDQAICFCCGGGLKDWEETDDPWEQHALWFPKCPYLLQQKGSEYIKSVKEKRDPRRPSITSASSRSNPSSETKETVNVNLPEQSSELKSSSLECAPHTELSEKPLCKICYKNEMCVLFKPCNHIVSCVECSWGLKTCAVCRKPVERRDRVFLS
ncbi:hypothetical protein ABEB36_012624 [Hypothenemus hampei]|uniref:RING-type domain-containing protein n=1 Tax=Hypothenemus hampei TaxID=57062 RepID=A0ABD1ECL4_HYPHA